MGYVIRQSILDGSITKVLCDGDGEPIIHRTYVDARKMLTQILDLESEADDLANPGKLRPFRMSSAGGVASLGSLTLYLIDQQAKIDRKYEILMENDWRLK